MKNKKIYILILICCVLILLGAFSLFHLKKSSMQAINTNKYQYENIAQKPTIGVLYVALGRYTVFWKEFYESSEKYFLPGYKKQYFIFTDSPSVEYMDKPNVKIIKTEKKEWPYPALLRYDYFLAQKNELKKYDYLFFFNSDLIFKNVVEEEILPDDKHDGLVFVSHCAFFDKLNFFYPYERNEKSAAYIPYGEGKVYVPGGINGGKTKEFLKFAEYCSENIHKDLKKGIIPKWHDEAYTNKYIVDKNPLILPINYMYVPTWECEAKLPASQVKAQIRDKQKYGGRNYLRGETDVKSTPLMRLKYEILFLLAVKDSDKALYYHIKKDLKF